MTRSRGGALRVDGGFGGTAASLADMESAARLLDGVGDDVRHVAGQAARCAASLPPRSVLLSPGTAVRAQVRLTAVVAGPTGLLARCLSVETVARELQVAAQAYREAEEAARSAVETTQRALGLPGAVVLAGVTLQRAEAGWVLENVPVPAPLDRRLDALAHRLGPSPAEALGRTLHEVPWTTDLVVGGARTALDLAGGPPLTYRHEVATLLAGSARLGWLDDRRRVTSREPSGARGASGGVPVPAPHGVADLLRNEAALLRCRPADGPACPGRGPGRIRILRVTHPDGSGAWVVELPGTQQWSPVPGPNPFDLTADVRLVGGGQTRLGTAVGRALTHAMAAAGVAPGAEPVMLTGHSQGGLLAASLAATPRFRRRFRVTHVVAAGAPVSRVPVPADIRVLALEHRADPVPRLDQRIDPDRARWVTVRRELGSRVDDGLAAHDSRRYLRTAMLVDRARDPSLRHWRRHSARFLDGTRARAWDVRLTRGVVAAATVEESIQ